jgi:hypothetical protein
MLGTRRGFLGLGGSLRTVLGGVGLSVLLVSACGPSEERDPPGDGVGIRGGSSGLAGFGGTGATGGSNATGGMGAEGGEGSQSPTVRITSPEALNHPDDGTVLTEDEVEVVCEVTRSSEPGAEPIAGVDIRMLDADGEEVIGKPAVETDAGVYVAPFFLQELPNGRVSFECSASDSAEPPNVGIDSISTFVDHGPSIEVISPLEDSAYSLGTVPFVFRITADPLVEDDPGSEVDVESVTLTVLGKTIELDEADEEYRASINLADTRIFPDPPPTVAVVISANNVREPVPGEAVRSYSFGVDSTGPVIDITSPEPADVVGGEVVLRFTVTDEASDVDEQSVFVTFNGGTPNRFDERSGWTRDGNEFSYRFDTTAIVGSIAQVNINIGAKDGAGNDAAGESMLLYLDHVPPIIDLDPPLVREYRMVGEAKECSVAFDPVGPLAANDGQTVEKVRGPIFRATVWDRTNPATFAHYAGVDRSTVYLYLQIDPQGAVLVDTDDDDECDEVFGRDEELGTDLLPFIRLSPVAPTGSAYFGPETAEPTGSPVFPSGCARGAETMRPASLCTPPSSDLTRVLPWDFDATVPTLYAIPPLTGDACTGHDWAIGATNGIEEGWVCLAARVVDNVGNVGVSAPLRVCYDDGEGPAADCLGTPPPCTDGCTVSPSNEFPPNQVLQAR